MGIRQHAALMAVPYGAGECAHRIFRKPHHLADIAHRRAPPVGYHRGRQARPLPAIAFVNILDHFLTALMFEIHIDIGRFLALRRDEALEQKIDLGWVDIGDAKAIADGGVGGGAAALAENVLRLSKPNDVVDREEIGRITKLRDHGKFARKRFVDIVRHALWKTIIRARPGKVLQMLLRRLTFGHRFVGIFVNKLIKGKGAGLGNLDRAGESIFESLKEASHLRRTLQMPLPIGLKAKPRLTDRTFLANAGQHVLERFALGPMIEHVVSGDDGNANLFTEPVKGGDACPVVPAIAVRDGEIEGRREGILDAAELVLKFYSNIFF
ncbi:hypothetical protein MnTg02_01215 [bacterium MnTg02]|nr:hypothetical protein MnTg02_01215 [bacterium MnTg02]